MLESNKDYEIVEHYIKDSSIVSRKIADEYILVPIKRRAEEIDSIYTLSEVAARIWELIDGENSVNDIRNIIVDEFEVSLEEAEADLVAFLRQLLQAGLVRKA